MDTESNIPVPDPIAPSRSAKIEIRPMHIPPRIAAIGMYLLRVEIIDDYWYPFMIICSSFSFLAISRGAYLLISSQNREKNAQVTIANTIYTKL